MTDRAFYAMLSLALLASVLIVLGQWKAGVFPTFMFLLIAVNQLAPPPPDNTDV